MKILVTGGAGYIGSHTCVELLAAGFEIVVFDNFDNSKPQALARIEQISDKGVTFVQGDVRNREDLQAVFSDHAIDAVIHFAGLKAVGESAQIPLHYYDVNVNVGKLKQLQIFGDDYPTVDGTGVRDYIHVVDLAKGHVAALQAMFKSEKGCKIYNLGAGKGTSVLEIVKAFEQASGKTIPYHIAPRREGDLAEYYADASLALNDLGWKTQLDINTMVADTWRWQSGNPNGYEG